jgi:hypothetical protein
VAFYVSTGARASELLSATRGGTDGITLHQLPQIPGSGDFLPNFLPKNAK